MRFKYLHIHFILCSKKKKRNGDVDKSVRSKSLLLPWKKWRMKSYEIPLSSMIHFLFIFLLATWLMTKISSYEFQFFTYFLESSSKLVHQKFVNLRDRFDEPTMQKLCMLSALKATPLNLKKRSGNETTMRCLWSSWQNKTRRRRRRHRRILWKRKTTWVNWRIRLVTNRRQKMMRSAEIGRWLTRSWIWLSRKN